MSASREIYLDKLQMKLSEAADWLNSRSPSLPPLIFLTDRTRVPNAETVAASLPAGSAIILRDYTAPDRQEIAHGLANLRRQHDLVLLVGGDVELADTVGADGVHFREQDLADPAGISVRLTELFAERKRPIITAAAHSTAALQRAADFGADAALLSPVFATASHPDTPPLGLARFTQLAAAAQLPVYALGGIDETNAGQLLTTNAIGIAAIGALSG